MELFVAALRYRSGGSVGGDFEGMDREMDMASADYGFRGTGDGRVRFTNIKRARGVGRM